MAGSTEQRRLAAIMFTDRVGDSAPVPALALASKKFGSSCGHFSLSNDATIKPLTIG
jgi:hypothetical protein